MNLGITLGLITLITIILILSVHKWTYKITRLYIFQLILGLFCFIYFLVVRYIPDFKAFLNTTSDLQNGSHYSSLRWSKILLLDMCPLSYILLSLAMVFDKSKSVSKVLAPVALLGGIITIFGQITFEDVDSQLIVNNINGWQYIFLGKDEFNRMYFLMHYLLIVMSLLVILNTKTYTRYSLYGTGLFYIGWIIYCEICIHVNNVQWNATGLVQNDWYANAGEYHTIGEMIPMEFPAIVVFWYTWALVFNFLVCMTRNLMIRNNDYLLNEKWWYKNNSFLNSKLTKIDNIISIHVNFLLKHKHPIKTD